MVIVLGLVGTLFLQLFYASVRVRWPNNYITLRNEAEQTVSRGPLRYGLFRGGPFALVSLATSVSADRLEIDRAAALSTLLLSHLALTNGRSLLASLRAGRVAANTILSNSLTALGLLIIGLFMWRLGPRLAFLVPELNDFVSALWTGLTAAVLAVFLQSVVNSDTEDLDPIRLAEQVSPRLQDYIDDCAWVQRLDPTLMRAVIYTEVLNRPRWTRGLERAFGSLRPGGTFGVGQTRTGARGSDERSIEAVAAEFANARVPRFTYPDGDYSSLNEPALRALLERHNAGKQFLDTATQIFNGLESRRVGQSEERSATDQPLMIVDGARRVGARWVIQGTCDASAGERGLFLVTDSTVLSSFAVDPRPQYGRRAWRTDLSVEERSVGVAHDIALRIGDAAVATVYLDSHYES